MGNTPEQNAFAVIVFVIAFVCLLLALRYIRQHNEEWGNV